MEELKPCPFCGGKTYVFGLTSFCVKCDDCRASVGHSSDESWYDGAFDTVEEAIAAWNTRAERTCNYCAEKINRDCSDVCSWCSRNPIYSDCYEPKMAGD